MVGNFRPEIYSSIKKFDSLITGKELLEDCALTYICSESDIFKINMAARKSITENNIFIVNLLSDRIKGAGHNLFVRDLVKDDKSQIIKKLNEWILTSKIDVVIATGGTGLTGRDVTPEAFQSVFEKEIPGFVEIFRVMSYEKIGTSTIQSRAIAGVSKGTYLFALPGSPGACRDAWDEILIHQLDYRFKPCNLVELMPRLLEV